MNPQIRSIADIYSFNTLSLQCVLGDLSDEHAGRRWRQGEGSSIQFLAGHLLSSRFGLLQRFGAATENPYAAQFSANSDADPATYPSIGELARAWNETAPSFTSAVDGLSQDQLETPVENYPITDQTVRGALMFLAFHESYHVGQIGLMLTEMGLPSIQARIQAARSKPS